MKLLQVIIFDRMVLKKKKKKIKKDTYLFLEDDFSRIKC